MAETITVTRAQLAAAIASAKDSGAEPKNEGAEGIADLIFDAALTATVPAGEIGVGGPDSGITGDDNVDNTAANNG